MLAARQRDMGVFIISPNDKGGKLYDPPPKLTRLCAPLTPMQFKRWKSAALTRPAGATRDQGSLREF